MRRNSLPIPAVAFVLCTAFAVIAGLLVLHGSDDQANHVTVNGTRIALTKQESLGHVVFAQHCASCHQLAASNSIGQVGPNLDYVSPTVSQVENIVNNGLVGSYGDILTDLKANREAYNSWASQIRELIRNPKKRNILAPWEPPHPFGTKRPALFRNFYQVCDQDNVTIVDTNETPVTEVTAAIGVKRAAPRRCGDGAWYNGHGTRAAATPLRATACLYSL